MVIFVLYQIEQEWLVAQPFKSDRSPWLTLREQAHYDKGGPITPRDKVKWTVAFGDTHQRLPFTGNNPCLPRGQTSSVRAADPTRLIWLPLRSFWQTAWELQVPHELIRHRRRTIEFGWQGLDSSPRPAVVRTRHHSRRGHSNPCWKRLRAVFVFISIPFWRQLWLD